MSDISIVNISDHELSKLLQMVEGHFCDLKAIEIAPAKLTRTISAFSNSEGGEVFIGIDEDNETDTRTWRGFETPETANGHIQTFEQLFPLGADYSYDFLANESAPGYVLKVQVAKTREIKTASNGKVYARRSAQNLPIENQDRLESLKRDKGLISFETEPVNCDLSFITNSEQIIRFMLEVVPTSEPETWLTKQQVILQNKPTVAGIVLFSDEPQALLPKRCGIKLYRYKTSEDEGTRESLDFDPISIEGCAYDQVIEAVRATAEIIESVRINTSHGLQSVNYPITAVHEIITNAVLHRDYSVADDIHIKIFDNRVEVFSPGSLPGHITVDNILDERFARNGVIVRLINKFPNPPNKDVGEGLNTAFQAMREMKLKDPIIKQRGGYVVVILRHESLASPEEMILEYLEKHENITNRIARDLCYIGSENKMKTILQRMIKYRHIELVPGRTRYTAAYQLPTNR
ncbi:MAG: ATP-binding protein [Candidatus Thiodiazotropha sp. (ex. Lucinoma kazani)]